MARPLVIAHVLTSFGMGGQERVALDLAREQVRGGHRVLVVSLGGEPHGPLAEEFAGAGAAIVSRPKAKGIDAGLVAKLAALFLLERVDVVHTHNPQPLIYAAPAARLARARVVHSKHGVNPHGARALILRRQAARLAHAFVAVSQLTATTARQGREVAEKKLRVIDNGVDLSRFTPDPALGRAVRAELGVPAEAFVVGTVGRLMPEKDQTLLIRAMAPLAEQGAVLLVVGAGPDEAALAALIASLGPAAPNLRLLGLRRDVPRVLAAFDVFALSSKLEGLPLVLPEAMAMALPVVATAVGGVPGVVHEGETGFLVPAGDEKALRTRLETLRDAPGRRASMGARGREVALADYSAVRMAADYLRVYRDVLGDEAADAEA